MRAPLFRAPLQHVLLSTALVAGLGGCGLLTEPRVRAEVQADRAEYRPGEVVGVSITNLGTEMIFNERCGGVIEGRQRPGNWTAVGGSTRNCQQAGDFGTGTIIAIPPRAVLRDSLTISDQAGITEWRVVLDLRDEAGRTLPRDESTARFTIAPGLPR